VRKFIRPFSGRYASARRVFWIVDNGSSHRGQKAVRRLERRWPNLVLVHLPVHASWLNQIEIYFSIVQRKVLEPNDFQNLAELARTLNGFERHWNEIAEPFEWNFTRDGLAALIERLTTHQPQVQLAA
jgi:transposase